MTFNNYSPKWKGHVVYIVLVLCTLENRQPHIAFTFSDKWTKTRTERSREAILFCLEVNSKGYSEQPIRTNAKHYSPGRYFMLRMQIPTRLYWYLYTIQQAQFGILEIPEG